MAQDVCSVHVPDNECFASPCPHAQQTHICAVTLTLITLASPAQQGSHATLLGATCDRHETFASELLAPKVCHVFSTWCQIDCGRHAATAPSYTLHPFAATGQAQSGQCACVGTVRLTVGRCFSAGWPWWPFFLSGTLSQVMAVLQGLQLCLALIACGGGCGGSRDG